jgi:Zn ribbon nucleic-acid-binding protein
VKFLDSLRLNPPLAAGIRRFGFRKWYERELIFSHIYLALALMALAGLLGAIEVFSGATPLLKLLDAAFVLICGVVVFISVQGYLLSLTHAESMANQAKCSSCHAYGRLDVISEDRREETVHVRCKKCGHHWTMEV